MSATARRPAAAALAALLGAAGLAAPAAAQDAPDALLVAVPHPITSHVVAGIKSQIDVRRNNAQRPIQKVVFDFTPGGKDAVSTDAQFGECLNLAEYIHNLPVERIAWVHGRATGHTVLPVLACNRLAMGEGARLGEVVTDGVARFDADPVKRAAYLKYFALRPADRYFPVVEKMFDQSVDLRKGETRDAARAKVYVNARDRAAADRVANLQPVPAAQPNQYALYDNKQAMELDLCEVFADAKGDLETAFGIHLRPDPLGGRTPNAWRYTLSGEVTPAAREAVGRVVKQVKADQGNVLFLTLDKCHGGDLNAARGLADDLIAAQAGDDGLLVVAFVPDLATDAATFVALGCTEIVMSKRAPGGDREAEIGDFDQLVAALAKGGRQGELDAYRKSLRELAVRQGYQPVLVDGMFDKGLEIVWARNTKFPDRRRLMTRDELAAEQARPAGPQDKDQGRWADAHEVLKRPGELLKLGATKAKEVGLARYTIENAAPDEMYVVYQVEKERVRDASPGWLDAFAAFLRKEWVTVLLVVIGFTGLLLEMKAPGLTVPGIVAALCFILVFWAQSRVAGGTAIALAILLFILGLVLVGLEIFVLPGFGVCGITGILCMLAGLALVAFDKVPDVSDGAAWGRFGTRVSYYLLGMIGAFGLAFAIARFLPRVPYANRLMLGPPADKPEDALAALPGTAEAAGLLGAIGTANTPLRPAGVVRFADRFVDVVSDGGFIPAGTRVQVIAVEATRIVVKEV